MVAALKILVLALFALHLSVVAAGSLQDTESIKLAQINLTILGYTPGTPDGVIGPRTVEALRQFQLDNDLYVSGILEVETSDLLKRLVEENRGTSGHSPIKSPELPKRKKANEPPPRIAKVELPGNKVRFRGITASNMRKLLVDSSAQWSSKSGMPWIVHSSRNPLKHNSDSGMVYVWWPKIGNVRKAPVVFAYWEILTNKDGAGVVCWYATKEALRQEYNHCYNGVSLGKFLFFYKSGYLPVTVSKKIKGQGLVNPHISFFNFQKKAEPDLAAIYDSQVRRREGWNLLLQLGQALTATIVAPSSSRTSCPSFYRRDGNGNCSYAGRPPPPR